MRGGYETSWGVLPDDGSTGDGVPGSARLPERDVRAGHGVVLAQDEPVGVVATVLARHVGDAGSGRRPECDDGACGAACHEVLLPPDMPRSVCPRHVNHVRYNSAPGR